MMKRCPACAVAMEKVIPSGDSRCPNCGFTDRNLDFTQPYTRPSRVQLHLQTAMLWAARSLCSLPDRKIGAVITTKDMRQILAIGYNGPAKGLPDDYCLQKAAAINELPSRCNCLHAEMNAISSVDGTIPDKTLFITMTPCIICAQLIVNSRITRVYYGQKYRNEDGLEILHRCGIQTLQLDYGAKS